MPIISAFLSSRIHVAWSLAAGGRLGVGNDPVYVKTACFEKFPFPAATAAQQARIRAIAERLDAHRKRQQERHPTLTLTDMYNVLERLRALIRTPTVREGRGDMALPAPSRSRLDAGRPSPLTAKERTIHEQGLVAVLRQLHDELDAAVADAYGWPVDLPDGEILQRLVDLNARRAAEEAAGVIRWLRPEYQRARAGVEPVQAALVEEEAGAEAVAPAVAQPLPWPASMPEQARAVRGVLQQAAAPLSVAEVAARFGKADKARIGGVAGDVGVAGAGGGGRGAVWRVVMGCHHTWCRYGLPAIQRDKSSSSISAIFMKCRCSPIFSGVLP